MQGLSQDHFQHTWSACIGIKLTPALCSIPHLWQAASYQAGQCGDINLVTCLMTHALDIHKPQGWRYCLVAVPVVTRFSWSSAFP